MSHLKYYTYQTAARGISSVDDVVAAARNKAFIYDRIVRPWLPESESSWIVELACGHGSFLYWLRERGYSNVTGVDSSFEQIRFARQVGVTVAQEDVNQWLDSQADGSLATVVGIDLIEHLSKDDFMRLLGASHRVLARGGRLILRYPNGDSPLVGLNLFNDITHIWTYTTNCLDTLARMHGFSKAAFCDESAAAIRDRRWLKVPICKGATAILNLLFRSATKEKVGFWSPHIWACLTK